MSNYNEQFKEIPQGFNPDKLLKLESTPKCFIPSIEDLHIEYELEIKEATYIFDRGFDFDFANTDIWGKGKLDNRSLQHVITYWRSLHIRVPYLNKPQIEAQGWKQLNFEGKIYGGFKEGVSAFEKGNYFMIVDFNKEVPFLDFILRDPSLELDRVGDAERFRFFCDCKDINTLRQIEKLLKIQ